MTSSSALGSHDCPSGEGGCFWSSHKWQMSTNMIRKGNPCFNPRTTPNPDANQLEYNSLCDCCQSVYKYCCLNLNWHSLDDVTHFGNVQWTALGEYFLTRPTVDTAVDKTNIRVRVLICEYLLHVSCHVVYLWSHQQNVDRASGDTKSICANRFASSGIGSLCQTRNDTIYIPPRRTVYTLFTQVWFLGYILLSGSQLGICMSRYQIALKCHISQLTLTQHGNLN